VNQYLYYSLTGNHEAIYQDHHPGTHEGRVPTSWYQTAIYTPLTATVEPGQVGPAAKSLRSKMHMVHGPAPTEITQEVILYPGVKRVDFVNRLHKKETLNKEEVYYAFPLDVPDFRMHCELPGAVLEPHRDQLSGSFTGFSGIQHWADVSNQDFGITVATREVPTIEFGEIRTNEWSLEYQPKRSAFFFYVMNNKENTNGAFWQGASPGGWDFLELHFAVTSHRGDWRDGRVTRFGWEHNAPLVARVIATPQPGPLPAASRSFCEGLPEHVITASLEADRGRSRLRRPVLRNRREVGNGGVVRAAGESAGGVFDGLGGAAAETGEAGGSENCLRHRSLSACDGAVHAVSRSRRARCG